MKKILKMFGLCVVLAGLASCGGTSSATVTSASETKTSDSSAAVTFDASQAIHPYNRDKTSGTRDGFMTKIGIEKAKNDDSLLWDQVQTTTGNGDMIAKVASDEYGIGYFSFSSANDAAAKGAKVLSYQGITPTEEVILDGTYQLSRNFNYCIRNDFSEAEATKKLIVEAFVAYMGTSEGATTIKGAGGLVKVTKDTPSWDDIKANYPGIGSDHSSIKVNFGGSTSVEKVAEALSADFSKRAGNFEPVHDHHGSGDAYTYTQGSETHKYDIAFASREFKRTGGEALADGTYGKVCVDGIVVGVNSVNPLTDVTGEQLLGIYSKDGTNRVWSDLIK